MKIKGKEFDIIAIQNDTELFKMPIIKGEEPVNWKRNIVVNTEFFGNFSTSNVGDSISIVVGNNPIRVNIAGVIKLVGAPTVYTSMEAWNEMILEQNRYTELKIQLSKNILDSDQSKTMSSVEQKLTSYNIYIIGDSNTIGFMTKILDHILIILYAIMAMAGMVLIIGSLGIISVMNINIMERKREIGIMRAIGGSNVQIQKIIITEMLLFGLVSWILAWLVSIPVSRWFSDFFGLVIIETELDFMIEPMGFIITFIVMLAILFFSGIFPIRNARKITVREALVSE